VKESKDGRLGSPRSSREVIEDFYGEEISPLLRKKIRQTPFYQLLELAERIVNNNATTVKDAFQRSGDSPLFIHDQMYLYGGRDTSLIEASPLRHLILHAEHFALPDEVADWAEDVFTEEQFRLAGAPGYSYPTGREQQEIAHDLANYVRRTALLSPLIRSGCIVLLPSKRHFPIDRSGVVTRTLDHYGEALDTYSRADSVDDIASLIADDPYMAWVVVNKLGLAPDWEYDLHGYDKVADVQEAADFAVNQAHYYPHIREKLTELFEAAYDGMADPTQVRDAIQLGKLCGAIEATPIISRSLVRAHLLNAARVVLDGRHASLDRSRQSLDAAVAYRVPSLAAVSFADLMRLRLNEEIYYEVRRSLDTLALSVGSSTVPKNYATYERQIRERAEDIVRPAHEKLKARLRHENITSLMAGFGVGGLISLGISGLAMLTHGVSELAVRSTGTTANNLGKAAAERKFGRNRNELSTACSILVTLLEDEPAD
jgi:hypothetical protein